MPKASLTARAKGPTVGLEFDGQTLRATIFAPNEQAILGTAVFSSGESILDAFAQWKDSKANAGPATAVWVGANTHFDLSEMPDLPAAAIPAAIRAAADDNFMHAGDGVHSGGVVGVKNILTGQSRLVVAGVSQESVTSEMWRAMDHAGVTLTLPTLLLNQDGVFVGIHGAHSEISIVSEGTTVFSRPLDVGGVEHLVGMAADPVAHARVEAAVSEYIEDLDRDIAESIAYAQSHFDFNSTRIWVYGPGCAVPGLVERLGEQSGADIVIPAPAANVDDGGLSETKLGAHFMGLLAATATDRPFAAIPNPYRAEQKRRRDEAAAKSKRATTAIVSVAVAAALLALLLLPPIASRGSARSKNNRLTAELAALAGADSASQIVTAGQAAFSGVSSDEIHWDKLIRDLLAQAPQGTAYSALTVNKVADTGKMSVQLSISIPGGLPAASAFLTRLGKLDVPDLVPSSVNVESSGSVSMSVAFTMSDQAALRYMLPRDVPGVAKQTAETGGGQ